MHRFNYDSSKQNHFSNPQLAETFCMRNSKVSFENGNNKCFYNYFPRHVPTYFMESQDSGLDCKLSWKPVHDITYIPVLVSGWNEGADYKYPQYRGGAKWYRIYSHLFSLLRKDLHTDVNPKSE